MHPKKLANVIAMAPQDRYWYFVRNVAEFQEVWGLQQPDELWKASGTPDGQTVYPFWPEMEFARAAAAGEWQDARPKSIPLDEFLQSWMPGMERDGALVGVFWEPTTLTGIDVAPPILRQDLLDQLKLWE